MLCKEKYVRTTKMCKVSILYILVSFQIYGSLFSMLQLKWICEKLAVALFIACLIITYHFVQYRMVKFDTVKYILQSFIVFRQHPQQDVIKVCLKIYAIWLFCCGINYWQTRTTNYNSFKLFLLSFKHFSISCFYYLGILS